MALDRDCKNYFYRLGRLVAVVEKMAKVPQTFSGSVYDNAEQKLLPDLRDTLNNANKVTEKHPLTDELFELASVGLDERKIPFECIGNTGHGMTYWLGYEHEKKYIMDNYPSLCGMAVTEVYYHVPEHVEVPAGGIVPVKELHR